MNRNIALLCIIISLSILLAACQPTTPPPQQTAGIPTQVVSTPAVVPTETASPLPSPTISPTETGSPTSSSNSGSITGKLGYPSEIVPALHIVAFLFGTDKYYSVDTKENQTTYQIGGLPEGKYHVVAYTKGEGSFPTGLSGGYTLAVQCGMGEACTDHTLVDIPVMASQTMSDVNIFDWLIPVPPMPEAGKPVMGMITGNLSYPSEFIPPMRVIAYRVDTDQSYFINTRMNDGTFMLPVPAGTYHVVAYVGGVDATSESMSAGYSQAVLCGLSVECTDHSLIDVVVQQGSVIADINPGDFYAPAGNFPKLP